MTVFFFITGFVMYLAYGEKACREDFKYWVRRYLSETLPAARRVLPSRDASASHRAMIPFSGHPETAIRVAR